MSRMQRRNGAYLESWLDITQGCFDISANNDSYRPVSENAAWEPAANPDQPFDYDAEPNCFYFDVESIGNLEPDMIIQQGIVSLQRKLATTVSVLLGEGEDGHGGAAEDAEMMGANDPDVYEPPEGIDGNMTAYGNGAASAWGASAQTPYGATPYGQSSYGF